MNRVAQRTAISARLIGRQTQRRWRHELVAEGVILPSRAPYGAAFADLSGSPALDDEIEQVRSAAGILPLVIFLDSTDDLPKRGYPQVTILRGERGQVGPVLRALRDVTDNRLVARSCATRMRAFAGAGFTFPALKPHDIDAAPVLLSDPHPSVLPLLRQEQPRSLTASLSASQTLRLLESGFASSLLINLPRGREHRLPVLRLIRRQTDLENLPVAVVNPQWTDDGARAWSEAGVDLIAHPRETDRVLTFLQAAARRRSAQWALRQSLGGSPMDDAGNWAPHFGPEFFWRIVNEHVAEGDQLCFGAIELTPDRHGRDDDLSEAGAYLAMALSPLEIVCRPRPSLFVIAMPYADRYGAGRTMRLLQTLVEDLKFGEEPNSVLISARTATIEPENGIGEDLISRLEILLSRKPMSRALA